MDPHEAAINQLEELGLSAYAARTFVSLVELGTATAREISEVSAVPRTRVYDAVEELRQRGLVDVLESNPKQFWSISAETARRSFEQEYQNRVNTLQAALEELDAAEQPAEQRGVWTVDGQAAVANRVVEFFDTAEDEIVYMTVEELLTDELVEVLSATDDRGVSIKLGGVSNTVQQRIQADIPNAEMFESLWVWTDTPAGRLLMVDGRKTLVSALVNGAQGDPMDPRHETAIWGEGGQNSLVAVLKGIFTWRLEGMDSE